MTLAPRKATASPRGFAGAEGPWRGEASVLRAGTDADTATAAAAAAATVAESKRGQHVGAVPFSQCA